MEAARQQPWKQKRRPRTVVSEGIVLTDEGRFASHRELQRWLNSKIRQARGEIRNLERHVRFRIVVNDQFIDHLTADQAYFEGDKRVAVCIGVGDDPTFELKAKIVKALYGVQVLTC